MQFTKDRKFEEAWVIKSSAVRPSPEECKRYLDKEKFKVLILEHVWNSEDDDNRFVLTLFQDERVKMRNPEEFLNGAIPHSATAAPWSYPVSHAPWSIWTSASAGLRGDPSGLYGVELGKVLQRRPDCAFIADGSPVTVFAGKKIR